PLPIGNYNYVTPYVHEITHGVFLAIAGIWALARLDETGRLRFAALAGFFLGLAFLTKAETFAGALAGDAAYLLALVAARRLTPRALGAFAAAAAVPPLASFALFATALSPSAALAATLGPWRPEVLRGGAARSPFFAMVMGIDDPASSLVKI